MKISHHFDDATLMAYSAGTLPQGMALLVACHLHWCPHCRERMQATDAVGGALLEQLPPSYMQSCAFEHLMSMPAEQDPEHVTSVL